jgi:glutaminase
MYDSAGKFGRLIGLPAKSGVGGGILVVIPGVMGICTYSPRLDRIGNSLRGLWFLEQLLDRYALHMLELPSMSGERKSDIKLSHLRSRHQAGQEIIEAASLGDVDAIKRYEHSSGSHDAYLQLLQDADYDGRTPLHLASVEGCEAVVAYLLETGVSRQPVDRWGQTPLADAERGGYIAIADRLRRAIAAAADMPIDCPPVETERTEAAKVEAVDNVRRLFAPARASTPETLEIIWAAAKGDVATLRRHVARGHSLHIRDYDDRTPLHLATAQGHELAIKYLIYQLRNEGTYRGEAEARAIVARLSWLDRWGRTPLDEAADPRILADADDTDEAIRSRLPRCADVLEAAGALRRDSLVAPEEAAA